MKTIVSGDENAVLGQAFLNQKLIEHCSGLKKGCQKILLIPPDITRLNSMAGEITAFLYRHLSQQKIHVDVMPALGTHVPMTEGEKEKMFGNEIPGDRFLNHHWRDEIKVLGEIPKERVRELSAGKVEYDVQIAVNKTLLQGGYDEIISIGQIVPHEVIGMANYTKNILIGVGGGETIHKSHFLGAAYGMERIMGRIDSPVRSLINEGFDQFLGHLSISFILTVIGKKDESLVLRGLFCGKSESVYREASLLSQKVNLNFLDKSIRKAVVYLDPEEFKTTWLGNKAIYRLRMAMADEGELIILAPVLHRFGEDDEIDRLIRKYGYRSTESTLESVGKNKELRDNLSAAAHLIHGTSDGRFKITYCSGQGLSVKDLQAVGYHAEPFNEMIEKVEFNQLKDGWNHLSNGEEIFYVSNPALGLWTTRERFDSST